MVHLVSVISSYISNVDISIPVLPTLLEDISNEANKWGNGGKDRRIDPVTDIFDVSSFRHSFSEIGAEFVPRPARLHHDRPYEHLPRPHQEWG